ncbi:AgrD family cyclic lactone autoinducer peptide [uncultured Faecalicoccus sp.]|uniref:AgrD family cyclic lactone autoinducer peptide n=1 Tax=uncultured Faecalicoccus sp. TaxID=1971760 RepID=UPI0026265B79|nr:cyclic lactone autoinducer peptide [uncultured Faecalicoccus sp.]
MFDKVKNGSLELFAKAIEKAAVQTVNSASIVVHGQKKEPQSLQRLKNLDKISR